MPDPRFRGGSTIANIFFVLRDITILAKQKMFKIDHPFDQENFQVRASECARYILHRIIRFLKKSSFFHVFEGFVFMNSFVTLRDIDMF